MHCSLVFMAYIHYRLHITSAYVRKCYVFKRKFKAYFDINIFVSLCLPDNEHHLEFTQLFATQHCL